MIYFKPNYIDEETEEFNALDGDELLGSCRLSYGKEPADVFQLSLASNDAYVGEGLLRAAFNFAANKGIYMGSCSADGVDFIVKKMNFEYKNGVYINDIPSILMGSCCKFDK